MKYRMNSDNELRDLEGNWIDLIGNTLPFCLGKPREPEIRFPYLSRDSYCSYTGY
jgi:hypothetical protein